MHVGQVWRYPVKSMGGERLDAARIEPRTGVFGDRAYALIDGETGTVASAKHPRKWGALLRYTASLAGGDLCIVGPDGEVVDDLSAALGRAVTLSSTPMTKPTYEELQTTGATTIENLAAAAEGTFFDYAPIHIVTTASLRRMDSERIRFRPNIVIDTGDEVGFIENAWEGQRVAIGDSLVLDVVFTCPRCVMTTLAQPGVPADPSVLRTAAELNTRRFAPSGKQYATVGMYATVITGGTIRPGDAVRVIQA